MAAEYSGSDQYNYHLTNHQYTDKAFAEKRYEASPLNRVLEQGAPGDGFQLGEHTVSFDYTLNTETTEVRLLTLENLFTGAAVHYLPHDLHKFTTVDEDANETIEYTDREGKTILKKSLVGPAEWAETYYVYNRQGQLAVVLPPEASSRLNSSFFGQSESAKKSFLNTWAFIYKYDGRKRMVSKKVPGADTVEMVYDKWDRLVLTQDGNQRAKSTPEWLFTKYDQLNRPIMTGLMTSTLNADSIRKLIVAPSARFDTLDANGTNQYSNRTYPTTGIDNYLTVTYYDDYAFQSHPTWTAEGLTFSDPESILTQGTMVKGQVTGTMTKAGDSTWIRTVSYYDDRYRPIQHASTNHLGGKDVVTNYFDFAGQVTKTISSHDTTTIKRSYTYDHAGRLKTTWHQLNNEDSVQIVANDYNELGELTEKNLHSPSGGGQGEAFHQSVDYSYNIRGWLTAINNSALTGGDGDLFGMELYYNDASGLSGQDTLYNGNISAMTWSDQDARGSGTTTRGYTYGYDQLNRLTAAKHFENGVSNANNKFDVQIPTYDLNGNIKALTRRGTNAESYIDSLQYEYLGNQLQYVNDASYDSFGFDNNGTGTNVDYVYDANGNMVKDRNKAIDSIYYNHLNLPVAVILSGSEGSPDSIAYRYDAAGIKLQQKVWRDDTLRKTTDYVGEFIYETGEDSIRRLQLVQHEEGRLIYDDFDEAWDYQYHLKDHLGNTRLTFGTTPSNYEQIGQFEDATQETDTIFFGNVNVDRVPHPLLANTGKAARLNSTNPAGPYAVLRVNKGDTVDLGVKAYYDGGSGYSSSLDSASMVGALVGAFGTSQILSEGGITTGQLEVGIGSVIGIFGVGGSSDDAVPGAYLNYMVFDLDMNYVGIAGFEQIGSAANGAEELVQRNNIEIEQEGYLIAYLSNESSSTNYVYFDDFTVYHGKTNVVQSDDYYPFGLTFNSYQRTASTPQRFGFIEKEKDDITKWNDFGARMYMPELGRWNGIDKKSEIYTAYSPYHYSYNSPIKFLDPDGEEIWVHYKEAKRDKDGNVKTRKNGKIKYKHHSVKLSINEETDQVEANSKGGSVTNGFVNNVVSSLNYIKSNNSSINSTINRMINEDDEGIHIMRRSGNRQTEFKQPSSSRFALSSIVRFNDTNGIVHSDANGNALGANSPAYSLGSVLVGFEKNFETGDGGRSSSKWFWKPYGTSYDRVYGNNRVGDGVVTDRQKRLAESMPGEYVKRKNAVYIRMVPVSSPTEVPKIKE